MGHVYRSSIIPRSPQPDESIPPPLGMMVFSFNVCNNDLPSCSFWPGVKQMHEIARPPPVAAQKMTV